MGVRNARHCSRADKADTGCSDRERFQLELEFVQSLANPHYINCARARARRGALSDAKSYSSV